MTRVALSIRPCFTRSGAGVSTVSGQQADTLSALLDRAQEVERLSGVGKNSFYLNNIN
nr:hypothetical protein [uncultured Nitrososphaera sp.]